MMTLAARLLTAMGLLPLVVAAAPAAPPAPSPAAVAAYSSASELQNRGMYDLAAAEWQTLLDENPTDALAARAYYNLGVCRFQTGAYADAAKAFDQATSAPGASAIADAAWANLGIARYNHAGSLAGAAAKPSDVYRQAISAFDQVLKEFPASSQTARARYYRAESLTALGRFDRAISDYRSVLATPEAEPMHVGARLGLAAAQLELEQPQQVETSLAPLFGESLTDESESEAYRLRGEARLATGAAAEAAEDFEHAAGLVNRSAAAELKRRQAYARYAAGQYGQAAQLYQDTGRPLTAGKCWLMAEQPTKAVQSLQPIWQSESSRNRAEAAHWLVQAYRKQQLWPDAAAVARQALDLEAAGPWRAPLRLALADSLYEQPQQRNEALAVYRELSTDAPDSPEGQRASYLAAHTALELKQHRVAIQFAEQFLKLQPNDALAPEARLIIAEAATQLGDTDLAIWQLEQLVASHAKDPRNADWTLRLGRLLSKQKRWADVTQLLAPRVATLAADPRADALELLAAAHREQGDTQAAEHTLTQLAAPDSDSDRAAVALYDRAELRSASNRPQEAAADFARVADRYPQHALAPYALYNLALVQKGAGDLQRAEASINRLLQNYQQGPLGRARFLLAGIRLSQQRPEDALALLDQADADPADLLYAKAAATQQAEQHDRAAQLLEQWLQQHDGRQLSDQVITDLAWLYQHRTNQSDRALALYDQLTDQHPQSPLTPAAYLNAGDLLFEKGSYQQAVERLAKVGGAQHASRATRASAAHLLGWCYFKLDQHEQALAAFQQQLEVDATGPLAFEARVMVGECLFSLGHNARALTAYRAAREQAPTEDAGGRALEWLHAGQAAATEGEWEESLDWLERASRANPTQSLERQIGYERGWAFMNLDRLDEAGKQFQSIASSGADVLAARAQFMQGEVQFAQKQHRAAVRTYFRVAYGYGGRDAAAAYHPWQAESLFEAARCLELEGRRKQAAELYAELLERFPDSKKAALARNRLQPTGSR